ncbi:MAG: xanthine dehydrogenase family protein subunit M [Planctomycetes bacterium]|nr:xanthine dehydrogenase family protein subunit M [Planctomycetota bacterium]
MQPFTYWDATSVEEAGKLLSLKNAMALGGGVDLLGEMKERIRTPDHVVNLRSIKGLDEIRKTDKGWRIGATALIADIAEHAGLKKDLPGLAEAALSVATPQIRNQGTLGGNLAQRPRCWYYRSADFDCAKKGGKGCPAEEGENRYLAVLGGGPCHIVHPSDCAPMLVALGARLFLRGPDGARDLPIEDFYESPSKNLACEYTLKPGEIIEAVEVPIALDRSTYVKLRERDSFDFALAACALAGRIEGDHFTEARLVLGGVAPVPWRVAAAESNLIKNTLADAVEPAANAAAEGAKPMSQNGYKVPLIRAAVARAIRALAGGK